MKNRFNLTETNYIGIYKYDIGIPVELQIEKDRMILNLKFDNSTLNGIPLKLVFVYKDKSFNEKLDIINKHCEDLETYYQDLGIKK